MPEISLFPFPLWPHFLARSVKERVGSVTVGLSKKDGKIILSIKDTGVGISEEVTKHLFTEAGS